MSSFLLGQDPSCAEEVGPDLAEQYALSGHHKRRLHELQRRTSVSGPVSFKRFRREVSLPPGRRSVVGGVGCMWCPCAPPITLAEQEVVDEEEVDMEFPASVPRSFGQGEHDPKFGRYGLEGIASDKGLLYVADSRNNCIFITQADGTEIDTFNAAAGVNLSWPAGLCVFEDELFVADSQNHRIVAFSLTSKDARAFGTKGHLNECFDDPEDVFAFADDVHGTTLLVADTGNQRIKVVRGDGTFVRAFGRHGAGVGEFHYPTSVTMCNGSIFVSDFLNHRVVITDLYGHAFRHVGSMGAGLLQFDHPLRLLASDTDVLVSDSGNGRLVQLDNDGTAIDAIAVTPDGSEESGTPCALCLHTDGGVFVTEIDSKSVVYIPPRVGQVA